MTDGLTPDDLMTGLEELAEASFGYGLMVGWFLAGVCVLTLKTFYGRCRNRRARIWGTAAVLALFGAVNLAAVKWLPG